MASEEAEGAEDSGQREELELGRDKEEQMAGEQGLVL